MRLSGASGLHCFFSCTLALAAAGGCYVGAPPRPRCAWYDRTMSLPFLAMPRHAIYDRCGVYYSLHFLISRAPGRLIASTGRQENCCSACRASTECAAAQMRNAVFQPDTHSEAAGASRVRDQAEVCGPVCLTTPKQRSRNEVLLKQCHFLAHPAYTAFLTQSPTAMRMFMFLTAPSAIFSFTE